MGAHECPLLFQLTGPCLGEVPTVQCARKEVKQRKKQTDSEEEYGRGEEEEEDRGSMSPSKDYLTLHPSLRQTTFFVFYPHPLILWPPPTLATVQSHRLNHSKLLFDRLNKSP